MTLQNIANTSELTKNAFSTEFPHDYPNLELGLTLNRKHWNGQLVPEQIAKYESLNRAAISAAVDDTDLAVAEARKEPSSYHFETSNSQFKVQNLIVHSAKIL